MKEKFVSLNEFELISKDDQEEILRPMPIAVFRSLCRECQQKILKSLKLRYRSS